MALSVGAAGANQQSMLNTGMLQKQTAENAQLQKDTEPTAAQQVEQQAKKPAGGCRTCASRKYQDGSNDPGVSFKSPTKISPQSAGAAVMAHEQEHVTREKQKAQREDRVVVAQSVTLHMGICPECKKSFVSGGTTRTTTASRAKQEYARSFGIQPKGKSINTEA